MAIHEVGIILNGVTGRMGTNQHLIRSILAIMQQGGIKVDADTVLMPVPLLTGRNANKLRDLAEKHGKAAIGKPLQYTTDIAAALKQEKYQIFFDASGTLQRAGFVEMAVEAGKAIYCEKPTAVATADALKLAEQVEKAGLKNGVVQDKLWLPGLRKLASLRDMGFFGKMLSVRGEFGYWVFTGHLHDQPAQRPSWNYRAVDGGGIMIDMFCHWQYVISNLFGEIEKLVAYGNTDLPERIGEDAKAYKATADDSAYAIFKLRNGIVCQFNSSWCTRVRRDDLLSIQVDGTDGSAVAGLRECWVQDMAMTPKPVWNPDIVQPIKFFDHWNQVPATTEYDNAFKIQWEMFIKHVMLDTPWTYSLREGAKGVQLAELGMQSWKESRWVDVPAM